VNNSVRRARSSLATPMAPPYDDQPGMTDSLNWSLFALNARQYATR
jgi:hypothetical protein